MAKRGRKKQPKVNLDIAVVGTIVAGVLLAVLIYTNSGFLGEHLSPVLGRNNGSYKIHYTNRNICDRYKLSMQQR